MNWKKALGFGLLLWIIMFVVASVFIAFNFEGTAMGLVLAIVSAVVVYILAGFLNLFDYKNALLYGLIFVVIAVILDLMISTRYSPELFGEWTLWLSYAL